MDVVVRASRFPREGETIRGSSLAFHPGGKGANQAVAAARLGARTSLVGCVGEDAFGDELVAFVSGSGVDTSLLRRASVGTGTAVIVVSGDGQNTIVVVLGANGELAPSDVLGVALAPGDVLLCQLETPPETVEAALRRAREGGATSVLNAAPVRDCASELAPLADVVVVNELERETVESHPRLVTTLGARGVVADADGAHLVLGGRSVDVVDTTGAGDCFVGALGARLAAGNGLEPALRYANAAASICVQREGAGPSLPTADEVAAVIEA